MILEPPRVEQRKRRDRSGILKWVGGFALVVILLIGTITNNIQRKASATPQPDPVLQHSREILQQLTPTPARPVSQPPVGQTRLVQQPARVSLSSAVPHALAIDS